MTATTMERAHSGISRLPRHGNCLGSMAELVMRAIGHSLPICEERQLLTRGSIT